MPARLPPHPRPLRRAPAQPQLADLLQRARQSIAHVAEGLFTVVEDHDGTGGQVLRDVLQAGARRELAVVVARDDVPHHQLVALPEQARLRRRDLRIGRAKQLAVNQVVGKVHILRVALQAHAPALLVGIGVVAHAVPGVDDAPEQVGIHLDVLSQHEEGRFGIVLVQRGEYPLRDAGRGSVVEGEEDAVLVVDLPDQVRHQAPDYFRWLQTHTGQK